jgi:hypothetical protein
MHRWEWALIGFLLALVLGMATIGECRADGLLNPKWMEDWDIADRLLLAGYTAAWFIDWGQTRFVADNPEGWYETNPHLGPHPDKDTVNLYFLASYGTALFLSNQVGEIRKPWGSIFRKGILLGLALNHYKAVEDNIDNDIPVKFSLLAIKF